MPLIDRPGRFKALITQWAVTETREAKLPQFVAGLEVLEWFNEGTRQMEDWRGLGYRATAFITLFTREGNPNEVQIKSLVEAIGWDGASLESLEAGPWDREVQIVVEEEEYQGRRQLKVKWINAADWKGFQVEHMEPAAFKGLSARWNGKLRALAPAVKASGPGTTKAATPPATGRPPASKAAPKGASPSRATKDEAFAAILLGCKGDQELAEREWFCIAESMFGGRQPDDLTPEELHRLKVEGPAKVCPI